MHSSRLPFFWARKANLCMLLLFLLTQRRTLCSCFVSSPVWGSKRPPTCLRVGGGNPNWLEEISKERTEPEAAVLRKQQENPKKYGPSGDDQTSADIHIPKTGISVGDAMVEATRDKFYSELVPIKHIPGAAQIVTFEKGGCVEPVRYIVSLKPPPLKGVNGEKGSPSQDMSTSDELAPSPQKFALVDVPPFSDKLYMILREYMGENGRLSTILITSADMVHYDDAPAVYVTRKSDINKWRVTFPGLQVVMYRFDIPRDDKESVTQVLDGYGPWAALDTNTTLVESGPPLTYSEWDEETAVKVIETEQAPEDDDEVELDEEFSPEAIRAREEDKQVLAVYTPGHTYGSVSYIFPDMKICCSGYTIPVEDTRSEANEGMPGAGPMLDYRGYISTSHAGMTRQLESARELIHGYADRFKYVFPARGDPLFLADDVDGRVEILMDVINQYDEIGRIYEKLGITGPKSDDVN